MTEDLKKLYDERVELFVKTAQFDGPARVPILSQVTNWAISYAGYKLIDVLENYDLEAEIFEKANGDLCFDGVRTARFGHMLKMSLEINSPEYFISPNEVTNQHHDHSSMTVEEYEELFENQAKLYAKVNQRKFKFFETASDEEAYAMVDKILKRGQHHAGSYAPKVMVEKLGLPMIGGAYGTSMALDEIFDNLRGFKNCATDLRRRPEKIGEAVDFLQPIMDEALPKPGTELPALPWPFKMHHIPTFLNSDLFEKFYWPHYRKQIELYFSCGTTYVSNFEGLFKQHFDFLQDLPDKSLIGMCVPEEYELWIERFGGKFGLIGGVPSSTMRFYTAEQQKEQAKKVIDLCAPHGGLVFSNDRSMIAPDDADPVIFRELNQFVAEYGKY